MTEVRNFVGAVPTTARSGGGGVPAQFQNAIDRHQNNLIALSAALKAAGITPIAAAGYVDDAIVSFQKGLMAAVAVQDEANRDRH